LGPCAGLCSRPDYGLQVRAARAFLDSTDTALLDRLEGDMRAASAALAFERAAALRDKPDALCWLQGQLRRMRRIREKHSFIYPVNGDDGLDLWYLIHRGQVAAVLPAPRTGADYRTAARTIRAVFRKENSWPGLAPIGEMDGLLLVFGWFRRH